ncbi:hypothetical protein BB558_003402 [Smittium angustum]|uniref:Beige protein homolog 1 n=1 Tax=Smittium angustum TaxID=133377 RepID=A0A2U1J6A5_SMIAN|nr:hypothetical protein BB558_003402 [Smittium angustum]
MNLFYNRITKLDLGFKPPSLHEAISPSKLLKMSELMFRWQIGQISNFDYLMALNTFSGRSYNDLSQYPVYPWVLQDYSSDKIDLENPEIYRDLKKPIGALDKQRLDSFIERYENFDDPMGNIKKFHYGTHYSSPASVSHFLIRNEPYTSVHILLQNGKFDYADRQFYSIQETWKSCLNSSWDVKELIPEFFYQHEFLTNTNGIDLGKKQNGKSIDLVELPPWADSSPSKFIEIHRKALESEYVSENLHHWIDLIFGYKQKGKEAEKAFNVFYYLTYPDESILDRVSDISERHSIESQIKYFGQIPIQLFTTQHPKRYGKPPMYKPLSEPIPFLYASVLNLKLLENSGNLLLKSQKESLKVSDLPFDSNIIHLNTSIAPTKYDLISNLTKVTLDKQKTGINGISIFTDYLLSIDSCGKFRVHYIFLVSKKRLEADKIHNYKYGLQETLLKDTIRNDKNQSHKVKIHIDSASISGNRFIMRSRESKNANINSTDIPNRLSDKKIAKHKTVNVFTSAINNYASTQSKVVYNTPETQHSDLYSSSIYSSFLPSLKSLNLRNTRGVKNTYQLFTTNPSRIDIVTDILGFDKKTSLLKLIQHKPSFIFLSLHFVDIPELEHITLIQEDIEMSNLSELSESKSTLGEISDSLFPLVPYKKCNSNKGNCLYSSTDVRKELFPSSYIFESPAHLSKLGLYNHTYVSQTYEVSILQTKDLETYKNDLELNLITSESLFNFLAKKLILELPHHHFTIYKSGVYEKLLSERKANLNQHLPHKTDSQESFIYKFMGFGSKQDKKKPVVGLKNSDEYKSEDVLYILTDVAAREYQKIESNWEKNNSDFFDQTKLQKALNLNQERIKPIDVNDGDSIMFNSNLSDLNKVVNFSSTQLGYYFSSNPFSAKYSSCGNFLAVGCDDGVIYIQKLSYGNSDSKSSSSILDQRLNLKLNPNLNSFARVETGGKNVFSEPEFFNFNNPDLSENYRDYNYFKTFDLIKISSQLPAENNLTKNSSEHSIAEVKINRDSSNCYDHLINNDVSLLETHTFFHHESSVLDLCLSMELDVLVSCSLDGTIVVCSFSEKSVIRTIRPNYYNKPSTSHESRKSLSSKDEFESSNSFPLGKSYWLDDIGVPVFNEFLLCEANSYIGIAEKIDLLPDSKILSLCTANSIDKSGYLRDVDSLEKFYFLQMYSINGSLLHSSPPFSKNAKIIDWSNNIHQPGYVNYTNIELKNRVFGHNELKDPVLNKGFYIQPDFKRGLVACLTDQREIFVFDVYDGLSLLCKWTIPYNGYSIIFSSCSSICESSSVNERPTNSESSGNYGETDVIYVGCDSSRILVFEI